MLLPNTCVLNYRVFGFKKPSLASGEIITDLMPERAKKSRAKFDGAAQAQEP
jgi:hypothetical protein